MIKLKNILAEGFAWERKEGKGLPTLAEVQAEYESKMAENNESDFSEYSTDALMDMKVNLSRYQDTENELEKINNELDKRKQNELYQADDTNDDVYLAANEAQDKVSSSTHIVYACNVEMADGSIKPGVRISVPKGNDAEKQVRDKIMARFGNDCKIRSIAKGQNPHINDNDKDEPRWQDNDGDGNWYEPGVDVKENVNESFIGRLKKNLLGGAVRK